MKSARKALVFPGQGSQHVGMGLDVYKQFPSARMVFKECEDALKERLSTLMFEGPQATLTLTSNAQPAILCHSIALLRVLEEECGFKVSDCTYALGHSLGEYTALVATKSLALSEAIKLVRLRGLAMQKSVSGETAMKALVVTGNQLSEVEATMLRIQRSIPEGDVAEISNINSKSQIVLSGTARGVEYAASILHSKGLTGRALPLPVSAPFHCRLMAPAAEEMASALLRTSFKQPIIDVISNVTATPFDSPQDIPELLKRQITDTVQWHRSLQYARDDFVFDWIPVGPSRVLANLLRKEYPHDVIMYLK